MAHEAVSRWQRSNNAPAPAEIPRSATASVEHAGDVRAPEPGWHDLAGRPAGALVREQAIAARQAAPVRTLVARVLGVHTDERAWRIGADGEELVAAELATLVRRDPKWHVLNAIPVGENDADIDHLVIGPGGVYSLNTKHHPHAKIWVGGNTFMINGARVPYVRNSAHEASRASRLLSRACAFRVTVGGVIVPVRATSLIVKTQPDAVFVVARNALAAWLSRRPVVLDDATVDRVFDAGRRSTTWRPT
jgi:hypothetical protein